MTGIGGMIVDTGMIVSIDYDVTVDGEVVETTSEDAPVDYMHGSGKLLPALEQALYHMREGERRSFILTPEQAYGPRDETSVIALPRNIFPSTVDVSIGARLAAHTSDGNTYPLTVCEVHPDKVVVDLNHPLAGKDLQFDVVIRSVRAAATGELFTGKPLPIEVV